MILEELDVTKARIVGKIEYPEPAGEKDSLDLVDTELTHLELMFGRLDDDLMGADTVHLVVDSLGATIEFGLSFVRLHRRRPTPHVKENQALGPSGMMRGLGGKQVRFLCAVGATGR